MKTRINGRNVIHIDSDTGETLCETKNCTTIEDGTLTESEEKQKAYIINNEINFCKNIGFVKLHDDIIDVLVERLTPNEFIFFMRLTQYISYKDCILRRTSHGNSSIMDMKMMSEEMNIEYSKVRKIVPSLKKKGLIGVHETGSICGLDTKMRKAYTVNPFVVFKGTDVNKTIAEFYRGNGWDDLLLNKKVIDMEKYKE